MKEVIARQHYPEHLVRLAGEGARAAVIANAMDAAGGLRAEAVEHAVAFLDGQ